MFAPAPPGPDWDTLLRSARDGARDDLGRLFEANRHLLTRRAGRELDPALWSKVSPSDLVQDTLLDAHREFSRFRGQSQTELRSWLLAILRHKVANLRRNFWDTGKRRIAREVPLEAAARTDAGNGALLSDSTCPSVYAIREEEYEALRGALDRLPGHYRQVITWRQFEGLGDSEIGARLGRTPDAVRMLWYRALRALGAALQVGR